MRYCKFKIFFCLLKIFFQNSQNLLGRNALRSNFFSQFVEKIEKLELSLSKQLKQMLKIRSEMLKII